MRRGRRGDGNSGPNPVPPFWLRAEANESNSIDPMVVGVAKENWPWAFRLAEHDLHDGASALEIVEIIAAEVSKRLRVEPEIGRHLTAYYRVAFSNRVRAIAARNGRIHYEGRPQDLEENYQPTAPDRVQRFEDKMVLRALLPYATETVRRMLQYRLLDYSWKEIGRQFAVTEKQARSRFYYGIRLAHQRLVAAQDAVSVEGNPLNRDE